MIDVKDVIDLLCALCDQEGLRVTATESLKAGGIAAVTTTIGGMAGGPVGLFVGGLCCSYPIPAISPDPVMCGFLLDVGHIC